MQVSSLVSGLVDTRGLPDLPLWTFWIVPSSSNLSRIREIVTRVGGVVPNSHFHRRWTSVTFSNFQNHFNTHFLSSNDKRASAIFNACYVNDNAEWCAGAVNIVQCVNPMARNQVHVKWRKQFLSLWPLLLLYSVIYRILIETENKWIASYYSHLCVRISLCPARFQRTHRLHRSFSGACLPGLSRD